MPTPRNEPVRKAPNDDALAWALAAAAHPHLSRPEADRIFIAIGVGDTFDAIHALLGVIVQDRIPLGDDLAATVAAWLDCYRGHDAAAQLRHLLSQTESDSRQRVSPYEERFGEALVAMRERRSG